MPTSDIKTKLDEWANANSERDQQRVSKQFTAKEVQLHGDSFSPALLAAIAKHNPDAKVKQQAETLLEAKSGRRPKQSLAQSIDAAENYLKDQGVSPKAVDRTAADELEIKFPIGARITMAFNRGEAFLVDAEGEKSTLRLSDQLVQQAAKLYLSQRKVLERANIDAKLVDSISGIDSSNPQSIARFFQSQQVPFKQGEASQLVVDLPGEGGFIVDAANKVIHSVVKGKSTHERPLIPATLALVVSMYHDKAEEHGVGKEPTAEEAAGEKQQGAREAIDQNLVKLQRNLRTFVRIPKGSPARTHLIRTMLRVEHVNSGLDQVLEDPELSEDARLVVKTYSDILRTLAKSFIKGLRASN